MKEYSRVKDILVADMANMTARIEYAKKEIDFYEKIRKDLQRQMIEAQAVLDMIENKEMTYEDNSK